MRIITDIESGSTFNLTTIAPTREDNTFIGWATSADGDVEYSPNATITINYDLDLYAKWQKSTCYVYFYANGGTGSMQTVTQAGGTSYQIPECGFIRDGYTFIGWSTSADAYVLYQPEDNITLTGDLTLYAKWAKTTCYVYLYANGGTGSMQTVTQAGGTSYQIPECGFTKDGYGFIGWATSDDGDVVYRPGQRITLTDNLELYAKWAEGIGGTCGWHDPDRDLDGTEVTWRLTKSEGSTVLDLLTISSSIAEGYMDSYWVSVSPWYAYREQIKNVVIGDGVKLIGENAFKDCTSLTSLNLPSVRLIEPYAFSGCTGLKSVTIGSELSYLEEGAFAGCSQLTSVTIYATSAPIDGVDTYNAFDSNADGRKIYVPAASVNNYKTSGWRDYASAIEPLDVIIEDGNDKSVLTNGQTKNIALKRTFPKGKKQTVCLPFKPTELLNYGKVWQFTGIEGGKAVMTQKTSSLSANTPYIFEATSNVWSMTFGEAEVNISNNPETVDATADFTFHGTYVKKHWDANDDDVKNGRIYGFLMEDSEHDAARKEGMFVKAKYNTNVRPFSCYLEYSGELTGTQTSSTARRKASAEELPDVIEIEWKSAAEAPGETTGIDELRIKNQELRGEGWYSLDGRRLSGKPSVKGLYIHNGKKTVMK